MSIVGNEYMYVKHYLNIMKTRCHSFFLCCQEEPQWVEYENDVVVVSMPTATSAAVTDPESMLAHWENIIAAMLAFCAGFPAFNKVFADTSLFPLPSASKHM